MQTIRLSAWAQSTVQMYASENWTPEDWSDDPEVLAVLAAWNGRALRFPRENAAIIARGLSALSNQEDAHYEQMRRKDPEGARMARWACEGLSNAALRASRI